MAYLIAAIVMTLSVLVRHPSIASLSHCICAPVDKISTNKANRSVRLQQQCILLGRIGNTAIPHHLCTGVPLFHNTLDDCNAVLKQLGLHGDQSFLYIK